MEKNSEFIDPQLLIRAIAAVVPREVFFTPSVFAGFYGLTIVSGLAALVGLFTRASLFLFALGIWILVGHRYSYADIHHPEAVFSIFFMALAFSPAGRSLSVDALLRRRRHGVAAGESHATVDTAMWPLKLGHVLLAMTYFSTGATKLLFGGPAWMNGYTLQAYTLADAMNRNIPLGIWLSQNHTIAVLLSVYTILFELFFFVSLFLPRLAPLFFLAAIFFQIGLYTTSGHNFFSHMVLLTLLLLFLDPTWWRVRLNKYLARHRSGLPKQEPANQPNQPRPAA